MLPVIATVDVVLMTVDEKGLRIGLIRREHDPFAGGLALPGGFVHPEEDIDARDAAGRILRSKVGFSAQYLEQLQTFSGPRRDPRGWSMSVAYYALYPETRFEGLREAFEMVSVDALPDLKLAFDHSDIINAALQRVRNKSSYSTLPAYLLPETFTFNELLSVYSRVAGYELNRNTFRAKITAMDILKPVKGKMSLGKHRPAQIYKLKKPVLSELKTTFG